MGQRARELLRQGCPVLAWLHEHNRDQNFSGVRYACENLEELDWDYHGEGIPQIYGDSLGYSDDRPLPRAGDPGRGLGCSL